MSRKKPFCKFKLINISSAVTFHGRYLRACQVRKKRERKKKESERTRDTEVSWRILRSEIKVKRLNLMVI